MGYDEDAIFVADIAESEKDLRAAFDGCDAVILTTSSVPRISRLSLPGVLLGKLFGKKVMPAFKWKGNSPPEMVRILIKDPDCCPAVIFDGYG